LMWKPCLSSLADVVGTTRADADMASSFLPWRGTGFHVEAFHERKVY
jgi:hypothetical protein